VMGSLLDALFIAFGLFLLAQYHPRGLTLLGAMVALTPTVFFITGVVNSSGLETAAAFGAWCGGLCIALRPDNPRGLILLTSLSFAFLILSRPISPLNAGILLLVLATLIGWVQARERLLRPGLRPVWGTIIGVTAVAGIFLLLAGAPSLLGGPVKPRLSIISSVWLTLRLTGNRLHQCIGDFGWAHTIPAPKWVVVVWIVALLGILAYGVTISRRCRRAVPLLVAAVIIMPVVLESPQIDSTGTYWQGRYWLPLLVGLPLVACSAVASVRTHERPAASDSLRLVGLIAVGSLLVAAQVTTFLVALFHFEDLAVNPGSPLDWTPPGGTALVTGLFVAGQLLVLGFAIWQYRDKRRNATSPDAPPDDIPAHVGALSSFAVKA
jgi:Predicted membrane protein (DUF2142)